jgi:membrane protein involved in colicin uptake
MSILDYKNLSPEQRAVNQTIATIEASAQHAANLQAAENAALEKAKRDAENEKLSEKFRAEREAELKKEAEEKRKAAAAGFEQSLRERFFRANEFATESDFQAMLPKLKEAEMIARMQAEETTEGLMRQSGSYGAM